MAEFNWDEQIKTNLDKVVEVLNNSEATSSKGSTEIARLLTDADKRKAKVDAQQEARELSQKAREEKQQQALDKLTESRDKLDTLESYIEGSSLFNKQQKLND